jgi:hypothetical protein
LLVGLTDGFPGLVESTRLRKAEAGSLINNTFRNRQLTDAGSRAGIGVFGREILKERIETGSAYRRVKSFLMESHRGYTEPRGDVEANWTDKSCCFCQIAYFPSDDITICGHWRRRLRVPIILGFCFLATFSSLIIDIMLTFPTLLWQVIAASIMVLLAILVVISYLSIIIRGPGYLPYNWSLSHRRHFTWQECMNNMVIYSEQEAFARGADRPPRASFSIDARRIVLRADHFCRWAQSWIGLMNHRYFLLMTSYVALYAFCYLICRVFWVANLKEEWNWLILIGLIATLVTVIPGLIALYYFAQATRNLIDGVTAIELFHNRVRPRTGDNWIENCEEICGERKYCCCWWCPCCTWLDPPESDFPPPSALRTIEQA